MYILIIKSPINNSLYLELSCGFPMYFNIKLLKQWLFKMLYFYLSISSHEIKSSHLCIPFSMKINLYIIVLYFSYAMAYLLYST